MENVEIENVDFLPSYKDNWDFLHYAAVLCGRVLVSNVPAFRSFKDIIVRHLPHQYSKMLNEKSKQFSLIFM